MDFVQPCPDEAFDWIRNGREESLARTGPDRVGVRVANLMPKQFEAYAKILHGIEANYVALREVRECIESLGEMLAKVQPPVHA